MSGLPGGNDFLRRALNVPPTYLRRAGRDSFLNGVLASALMPKSIRRQVLRLAGLRLGRCGISSGCYFGGNKISIGDGSFVNIGVFFDALGPISVGKNCHLAMQVLIGTSSHEVGPPEKRAGTLVKQGVTIEDGCWVGARAIVLPGVTIGRGCIIASGAVVTKDCEPGGLYAGVPARRLRDV